MTTSIISTNPATMSSREIAELTDKELSHVHRDIRSMIIELYGSEYVEDNIPEHYRNRHSEFIRERADQILSAIAGHFGDDPKRDHVDDRGFSWVRDKRGYVTEFRLNRALTDCLLTGYSAKARMKVITRWHELEQQADQPIFTIPQNLPDALRLAADLADENAKLKAQLEAKPLQQNNTASLRAADLLSKTVRALYDGGMPRPVALGLALEEVHRQTGVRMLPDYEPPKMPDPAPDRLTKLIKYVQKSKRYITHSQLLKKMHLTAADFKPLVAQAIKSGYIASRPGTEFGFGGVVYTLAGGAA